MYGVTNTQIVDALLAAKRRGVDVALKLDKLESAGKMQAVMITKLQAASAKSEAAIQHGSFGIGKGGLDVRAALFWAFVGIPLGWGVWVTLQSAAAIFK